MPRPYYVLSINGGGMRGIIAVTILCQMQAYFRETRPEFNIHDWFDLYAGTSIGALITNYFLITKQGADELARLFRLNLRSMMKPDLADMLFGLYQSRPKYDGVDKFNYIQSITGDHTFASHTKLSIVTAYDLETRCARMFNSSLVNPLLRTCDAVNASSSAPCYFPCVYVQNCQDKTEAVRNSWFVDGGLVSNNPTICALAAIPHSERSRRKIVLNIGTGYKCPPLDGTKAKNFGTYQWLSTGMLTIPPDGQLVEQQAEGLLQSPDCYINIDGCLPDNISYTTDDASEKNMNLMISFGKCLWAEHRSKFDQFFDGV